MKGTAFGRLRKRVTLERPKVPQAFDSFGQPLPSWVTVGTYWAEIRPLSTREAQVARQITAEASHAMTLRYLGADVALNPTCRFVWGGRTFGVVQVLNIEERNRRYELIVKEIQTTGQV